MVILNGDDYELGGVSNPQQQQSKPKRIIELMSDEERGIWNGGTTKPNGVTKEEARIFRQMEDDYDTIFSEIKTRDELVKREKMMKEESNYKEIQSNHKVSRKPMHELYKGINKGMSRKTKISGMGGPQIGDSDRFNGSRNDD